MQEKIKNPLFYEENKIAAHSDHKYFVNEAEFVQNIQSLKRSLDGAVYHSPQVVYALEHGYLPNPDNLSLIDKSPLESLPYFLHTGISKDHHPWDGHEVIQPGEIPTRFNPTASYVKYFTVPTQFIGKRVFLSFQGVESGFALWCNGSYIGYSEDSFTPSEFELTNVLREGENKLAVQVYKWTSGSLDLAPLHSRALAHPLSYALPDSCPLQARSLSQQLQ